MAKGKQVAAVTIKYFRDAKPEIIASDGIAKIPEELFSKSLDSVRSERQRIRVKLGNEARRDERLRKQEEQANA